MKTVKVKAIRVPNLPEGDLLMAIVFFKDKPLVRKIASINVKDPKREDEYLTQCIDTALLNLISAHGHERFDETD